MPTFDADIRPLFRAKDRNSMLFMFDLWSADDVREHAERIYGAIAQGNMPCDGRWTDAQTLLFRRWIDDGTA